MKIKYKNIPDIDSPDCLLTKQILFIIIIYIKILQTDHNIFLCPEWAGQINLNLAYGKQGFFALNVRIVLTFKWTQILLGASLGN